MDNHRQNPRHRVLKGAHIAFREHGATIDCMVRNLSEQGACLKVASPVGIPETFDLVLDTDHTVRVCRVVWRRDTQIGVKFQ